MVLKDCLYCDGTGQLELSNGRLIECFDCGGDGKVCDICLEPKEECDCPDDGFGELKGFDDA